MMTKYLLLHSCVQIVRGAARALILDTQRRAYWLVPTALADFAEALHRTDPGAYYEDKETQKASAAESFLAFLLEEELGFYVESREEMDCFPAMSTAWQDPFSISNAIIELNKPEDFTSLKKAFRDLYIPYIQFFINGTLTCGADLQAFLDAASALPFKTCQVHFSCNQDLTTEEMKMLCTLYPFVEILCAFGQTEDVQLNHAQTILIKTRQAVYNTRSCGIVHTAYFNPQLSHFTESLHHNTCLNRKISIDKDGNIKNCPSMRESFGNIADTTLAEALAKPGFKQYWNITKDQISICKDCEFRHVCTDCRAYLEEPEDRYSKPLKCGYDPYTCTWEEWSLHPMKQKAMSYYGMKTTVG